VVGWIRDSEVSRNTYRILVENHSGNDNQEIDVEKRLIKTYIIEMGFGDLYLIKMDRYHHISPRTRNIREWFISPSAFPSTKCLSSSSCWIICRELFREPVYSHSVYVLKPITSTAFEPETTWQREPYELEHYHGGDWYCWARIQAFFYANHVTSSASSRRYIYRSCKIYFTSLYLKSIQNLRFSPWRWRQHGPPKLWTLATLLQCHNPEDCDF
jgi:hypothetical protein